MNTRRSITLVAATSLFVMLGVIGCSKSDSGPTGPPAGTSFNSGTIAPAGQFQFVFPTEGHFPYHCSIHPGMQASIHVVAGGGDTARVEIANSTATGFQPQLSTVRPGGRVIWTNISSANHTVTSD